MYRLFIFYMFSANVSVVLNVSYKAISAAAHRLLYKGHPK
jgi:hypothetical protein